VPMTRDAQTTRMVVAPVPNSFAAVRLRPTRAGAGVLLRGVTMTVVGDPTQSFGAPPLERPLWSNGATRLKGRHGREAAAAEVVAWRCP